MHEADDLASLRARVRTIQAELIAQLPIQISQDALIAREKVYEAWTLE